MSAVRVFVAAASLGIIAGCGDIFKPDMPVKVTTRESLVGEGLVAQFHNELPRRIVVYVVIENEEGDCKEEGYLALEPNGMTEIGWLEGWKFVPGDTITISHEKYRTTRYEIE